jgi:uncharacterized protein
VVALTSVAMTADVGVIWHQHYSPDVAHSIDSYRAVTGWVRSSSSEPSHALGEDHGFAWHADHPTVGGFATTIGKPNLHAQWLFWFGTADVTAATDAVVRCGGEVFRHGIDPRSGRRFAVCHDPHGASFALTTAHAVRQSRQPGHTGSVQ